MKVLEEWRAAEGDIVTTSQPYQPMSVRDFSFLFFLFFGAMSFLSPTADVTTRSAAA